MSLKVLISYSKINLFLNVGKKIKKTHLHNIQSMIFQVNIYDKIYIKKNKSFKNNIKFVGKFNKYINKKNNTVSKSIFLLKQRGFVKKNHFFDITVKKNIPVFAGLGGGSSNAASIIKYFKKNKKLSKEDISYFSKFLGSDLIVFLGSSQIFQKNLLKIVNLKKKYNFYFVMVYPYFKCSSKYIYSKVDTLKRIENRGYNSVSKIDLLKKLILEKNYLEKTVISKYPKIKEILNELNSSKGRYFSRITGSGSTCFGVFLNKKSANKAHNHIKKKFAKFWCVIGKTI